MGLQENTVLKVSIHGQFERLLCIFTCPPLTPLEPVLYGAPTATILPLLFNDTE